MQVTRTPGPLWGQTCLSMFLSYAPSHSEHCRRIVGNPSIIRLGKSSPSIGHNLAATALLNLATLHILLPARCGVQMPFETTVRWYCTDDST